MRGKVVKSDVSVAKNYLIEGEIKGLERVVSMYLDYAENQAARQIPMKMTDWIQKLDAFLACNEYEVLTNAGQVSAAVGRRLAEEEYAKYRVGQDREFESDFEREVRRLKGEESADSVFGRTGLWSTEREPATGRTPCIGETRMVNEISKAQASDMPVNPPGPTIAPSLPSPHTWASPRANATAVRNAAPLSSTSSKRLPLPTRPFRRMATPHA